MFRASKRPQVITLADLHARVPQDVVGGGDVEAEIQKAEAEQIGRAIEGRLVVVPVELDDPRLAAGQLSFGEAVKIGERAVDARVKLREGLFGVLHAGRG